MSERAPHGIRCSRALLALAVPLLGGCASSGRDELWSFGATRAVWGENACHDPQLAASFSGDSRIALVVDALPIVVDLVVLPVTGVHDLWIAFH